MQWFVFDTPAGRRQVQAADQQSALALMKNLVQGMGYGATDMAGGIQFVASSPQQYSGVQTAMGPQPPGGVATNIVPTTPNSVAGNYAGAPLSESAPFGAYLSGLKSAGVPVTPDTYAGRYAQQGYGESRNAFNLANVVAGLNMPNSPFTEAMKKLGIDAQTPEEAANAFQRFSQTTGIGGGGNTAADLFRRFGGASGGYGANAAAGVHPNVLLNQLLQNPDEGQAGLLQANALAALGTRIAPSAMQYLNFPSGQALLGGYTSGDRQGGFMNYLRQNLGLQQAGF